MIVQQAQLCCWKWKNVVGWRCSFTQYARNFKLSEGEPHIVFGARGVLCVNWARAYTAFLCSLCSGHKCELITAVNNPPPRDYWLCFISSANCNFGLDSLSFFPSAASSNLYFYDTDSNRDTFIWLIDKANMQASSVQFFLRQIEPTQSTHMQTSCPLNNWSCKWAYQLCEISECETRKQKEERKREKFLFFNPLTMRSARLEEDSTD